MGSKIITASNISTALNQYDIIILDFWASWCGPCKVFGPIFDRVAEKNPDILFGKVDSEIEHDLCADFEIRSVPTLVILKNQTIILNQAGSIPEYVLDDIVKKVRELKVEDLEEESGEE